MSERIGLGTLCARIAAAALAALAARATSAGPCRLDEAQAMLEGNRAEEARILLEECAPENAKDGRAARTLGRFYLSQGNHDRAVAWLERAATLEPSSSDNQLWLGRAYGGQALKASVLHQPGLARKVRRAFERAVELDADNLSARMALLEYALRAPAFLGGSLAKARDQAEEIRRRDLLRGHRAFGRIAEHQKDNDVAAREYADAIREFPDSAEAVFWRVDLAASQRDYAAAQDLLESWAQRDPPLHEIFYRIGALAAASGQRLDRGKASLQRYLEHAPSDGEPSLALAHCQLGAIYDREKDRELARREYKAAVELDPMLTEARQALAKLK